MKKVYPLKTKLASSKVEKDVENVYRECFSHFFGTESIQITSPFGCDGYLTTRNQQLLFDLPEVGYRANSLEKLKILFEFKLDKNFNDSFERAKAIVQAIFYVKKFELEGRDLEMPNIIFIGDINEMFVLHYNSIQKYLDKNINWNTAPSSAADLHPDFTLEITRDEEISVHVVSVSNEVFEEVIEYIKNLNDEVQPHIRINEHNISRIFDDFIQNIILKQERHLYNAETLVGIFIGCLSSPDDYYLHPKKKNILVTPTKADIRVNSDRFEAFFKFFKGENYSIEEKRKFTEIQDRLIEDLARRRSGEYFTPTTWADEANNMITQFLGENWRDEYVVWDCACGTKNLTRDYSFSNLFCSTIHKSDIDVSMVYNSKNKAFQYDFLNDDINNGSIDHFGDKLPYELKEAIKERKPLLFFINPPYGTATADGAKGDGSHKKGMALNKMNEVMNNEGYGYSSQQLYAQFLARIIKLKADCGLSNVKIALFAPPIYMSSPAFKGFRDNFLKTFRFENAMLFSANNFADVSTNWGISFSLWSSENTNPNQSTFEHLLKEIESGELVVQGKKIIYNTDKLISGSDWAKGDFQKRYSKSSIDYPQMSSPINVKQDGRGTFVQGAIGFYNNGGNNIYQSEGQVGIYSAPFSNGNGYAIMPEYFDNIISNFIGRRFGFSYENWANQKDEFLMPDVNHPKYNQYVQDALVLTIFNPKAKVSSLRNVRYKSKTYNIVNQFFFMSHAEILKLANEYNNTLVYEDLLNFSGERFVNNRLKEYTLSPEAKGLLETAKTLVSESFKYRQEISEANYEYQLDCWDAGWFQLKFLIGKVFPKELSNFEKKYQAYFNKMKPLVYELEFLK